MQHAERAFTKALLCGVDQASSSLGHIVPCTSRRPLDHLHRLLRYLHPRCLASDRRGRTVRSTSFACSSQTTAVCFGSFKSRDCSLATFLKFHEHLIAVIWKITSPL